MQGNLPDFKPAAVVHTDALIVKSELMNVKKITWQILIDVLFKCLFFYLFNQEKEVEIKYL